LKLLVIADTKFPSATSGLRYFSSPRSWFSNS